MRAFRLEKAGHGPLLSDAAIPDVGPGEVRVAVGAVSIHPVDLETRAGKNAMMLPNKRPFTPGVDFAGTVEAIGERVDDLAPGDSVYGFRGLAAMGAFAEQIVVPRGELARAPAGIEPERLAAFPLPALCALQALDECTANEPLRVLVHGGAGGVGSIAVQIFAAKGHEVTATAGPKDIDWVHRLGASRVLDYTSTRFEDATSEVDLVFDTVGGKTLERSFAVVRPGGTVVSLGAMPDADVLRRAGLAVPRVLGWILPLMSRGVRKRAARARVNLSAQVTVPSGARLAEATRIAEAHGLECRIDRVFPFADLPQAMDHAASGEARGRVVAVNA